MTQFSAEMDALVAAARQHFLAQEALNSARERVQQTALDLRAARTALDDALAGVVKAKADEAGVDFEITQWIV